MSNCNNFTLTKNALSPYTAIEMRDSVQFTLEKKFYDISITSINSFFIRLFVKVLFQFIQMNRIKNRLNLK